MLQRDSECLAGAKQERCQRLTFRILIEMIVQKTKEFYKFLQSPLMQQESGLLTLTSKLIISLTSKLIKTQCFMKGASSAAQEGGKPFSPSSS